MTADGLSRRVLGGALLGALAAPGLALAQGAGLGTVRCDALAGHAVDVLVEA
jgi:hypothetical protein